MKDEIMTPSEFFKDFYYGYVGTVYVENAMKAYAKYIIESLSDEQILEIVPRQEMKRFSDSAKLDRNDRLSFKRKGMKLAREELLRRLNQRP